MRANGLSDLRSHAHHGVQRRHRLLKDHGDFAAAHADALALAQAQQIHTRGVRAVGIVEPDQQGVIGDGGPEPLRRALKHGEQSQRAADGGEADIGETAAGRELCDMPTASRATSSGYSSPGAPSRRTAR